MSTFQKYANYYDVLYRDKNYRSECDFLEKIFRKYSTKSIHSILDLGCGTGGHDLILCSRGYKITGVDLSAEMIEVAKRKAKDKKMRINFVRSDIKSINLKKKYDVIISMFAVISYQITNEDIISTFQRARNHLGQGGLFIFDCWFGPAVLAQKPQDRLKIIEKDNEKIIRFATPVLDILNQTVDVKYKIVKASKNKILDEIDEVHKMRFLFPKEIENYLKETNFRILEICPFRELGKIPTENDWNVTVIAEAIKL